MIRALLVDDETPARKRLSRLLETYADFEIIGEAENGVLALEKISELKPDLVFLDIEMPELDGLGVARSLGETPPAIVFVTAYDEHALKAFDAAAFDYLLKPVAKARLSKTIDRLREKIGNKQDLSPFLTSLRKERAPSRLAIRSGNRYVVFDPKKVSAIIARDHYAALLIDGRELLADDPLDTLATRLDPELFIRIHRSALININYLQTLECEGDRKYTAILSDTSHTKVPIARERLDEVKKKLGLASY